MLPPTSEGKEAQSRIRGALSRRIDDGMAPRRVLWWSGALLVLCLGLGWFLVETLGRYGEGIERGALLATVSSSASILPMRSVKALKGHIEEQNSAAYLELHKDLSKLQQSMHNSRFAYLVKLRGRSVIFLADSEVPGSRDYSPPGQVYDEATDILHSVFATKAAATEGPVADRWGNWVSAFAPIIDPGTGEVVAVLGVDIDARDWDETIAWFRSLGLGLSGLVSLIIVVSGLVSLRQYKLAAKLADANRIIENSTTLLFRLGGEPELPLTFVSSNIVRLGYDPQELLDSPHLFRSLFHPDDRLGAEALLQSLSDGRDSIHLLLRLRAKDGVYHWFDGEINACRDQAGRLLFAEGMLIDISERKEMEDKLVFSNTLLTTELEMSPDGILVVDDKRRIISFNQRFAAMFNVPLEIVNAMEDPAVLEHAIAGVKEPQRFCERVEYLYSHPNESARDEFETKDGRFLERHTAPLRTPNGQYLGRVWFFRDMTAFKNAELKAKDNFLRSQTQLRVTGEVSKAEALLTGDVEVLARQVTELASQATGCERVSVWLFNSDETELHCIDLYEATPACHSAGMVLSEKEFGPEMKIVKSSRYVNADDPLTDPRTVGYLDLYLKPLGITSMLDMVVRAAEQSFGLLCFEHVGRPHHWTDDEIGFAGQLADKIGISVISGLRRRAEEQIRYSAYHDGLTGLANREVFVEAVAQAIARAERGEKSSAVLYLDLDHFKDVNDTLGHPVGDELLRAVADRLRGIVRKTDLVARFGGDEFAILVEAVSDPADVANLAAKVIGALKEPYSIAGNDIRSGASIGITVSESEQNSPELMLASADIALYRAKSEARGSYRFFTEAMDMEVHTRVTLSAELRTAIDLNQLFLEYQPQVELETGRITGVEALVRWQHPKRGVLAPGEFTAVAEQTGLVVALDGWVLREACRQGKAWLDQGIAPDRIAVNMSALNFKRPLDLEQEIFATLADSGLPPGQLEIEITEGGLMTASREQDTIISHLLQKGVQLAIDDFGTGYSSLDYLRRYPAHHLKIAQVFVARMVVDSGSASIVRAIAGLARELRMVAIAEGVETTEQLAIVAASGCPEVQGFYFAKPLGVKDIQPLLRQGKILRPTKVAKGRLGQRPIARRLAKSPSAG